MPKPTHTPYLKHPKHLLLLLLLLSTLPLPSLSKIPHPQPTPTHTLSLDTFHKPRIQLLRDNYPLYMEGNLERGTKDYKFKEYRRRNKVIQDKGKYVEDRGAEDWRKDKSTGPFGRVDAILTDGTPRSLTLKGLDWGPASNVVGMDVSYALLDNADLVYGPSRPAGVYKTPWVLINSFGDLSSVSQMVSVYSQYYRGRIDISPAEYERYNQLVRTKDSNEAWQDFEYLLLPNKDMVDQEVSMVLRKVIDPNIAESTVRSIVEQVANCQKGGVFIRFKTPQNPLSTKTRVIEKFKVFVASCSSGQKTQILAFCASKAGYFKIKEVGKKDKMFAKSIIRRWLAAFFISRFSAPN